MHQVKIYDNSGNLKKVVSVKTLQKRSDKLIECPSLFRKTNPNSKPGKSNENYHSENK